MGTRRPVPSTPTGRGPAGPRPVPSRPRSHTRPPAATARAPPPDDDRYGYVSGRIEALADQAEVGNTQAEALLDTLRARGVFEMYPALAGPDA